MKERVQEAILNSLIEQYSICELTSQHFKIKLSKKLGMRRRVVEVLVNGAIALKVGRQKRNFPERRNHQFQH